jgi:hypothetical protein
MAHSRGGGGVNEEIGELVVAMAATIVVGKGDNSHVNGTPKMQIRLYAFDIG